MVYCLIEGRKREEKNKERDSKRNRNIISN
jgi:hypothetical protein